MYVTVIVTFVDLVTLVFNVLLLIRVVFSWIRPDPNSNWLTRLTFELTEPVLAPLRRLLPFGGMLDLAPLAAFILLQVLDWLVHYWAGHL